MPWIRKSSGDATLLMKYLKHALVGMKIAFIYDAVYPWIKGGAEKRIYEIAKRLVDKGHDVHWFGIGWWFKDDSNKTIEHDGIILHGVCEPMQFYVNGSIRKTIYFASNCCLS